MSKWLLTRYSHWCCLDGRVFHYHNRYGRRISTRWTTKSCGRLKVYPDQLTYNRCTVVKLLQKRQTRSILIGQKWNELNERTNRMNEWIEWMYERAYEWTKTNETKQLGSEIRRLLFTCFPLVGQCIIGASPKTELDTKVSPKSRLRCKQSIWFKSL